MKSLILRIEAVLKRYSIGKQVVEMDNKIQIGIFTYSPDEFLLSHGET